MASNGKPFSFDTASMKPVKKLSTLQQISDVIVFLLVSAVYILQVSSFIINFFNLEKFIQILRIRG